MERGGTKARIVETARRLFNEQGTTPVSTNHIAAALGMSPGNLYYHFRHKEAIVLAVFDRMSDDWRAANRPPGGPEPSFADLRALLRRNFAVLWDYRFFYRELPVLLRRDPELARRFASVRSAGLGHVESLLRAFACAGVLALPDRATEARLARTCWLIVEFWLPFAELGGETVGPDRLDGGVDLVLGVLHPYAVRPDRDRDATLPPPALEKGGAP